MCARTVAPARWKSEYEADLACSSARAFRVVFAILHVFPGIPHRKSSETVEAAHGTAIAIAPIGTA
jgi:hypothetical protein